MGNPVEATVHFTVTVRSVLQKGQWITKALETGIVTAGATRDEAETRNGKAHVLLVRRIKGDGPEALAAFMAARGLTYELGSPPPSQERRPPLNPAVEELPLAA